MSSPTLLCTTLSPALGVSLHHPSTHTHHALVTYEKQVQTYDLSTRRLLSTWTPPTTPLTHPAHHHAHHDHNTILAIVSNTLHISQTSRTFPSPLHIIHTHHTLHEIIVVFQDGRVIMVSHDGQTDVATPKAPTTQRKAKLKASGRASDPDDTISHIIHSQLTLDGNASLFTVIRSETSHGQVIHVMDVYHIRTRGTTTDMILIGVHALSPPSTTSTITSASFSHETRTLSLIWSTHQWMILRFRTGPITTAMRSRPIIAVERMLSYDVQHTFCGMARVAMIGYVNGASDEEKTSRTRAKTSSSIPTVTLWETLYGTCQTTYTFPTSSAISPPQIISLGTHVMISLPESIHMMTLEHEDITTKPSLAQAIGRMSTDISISPPLTAMIAIPLNETSTSTWTSQIHPINEQETKILSTLIPTSTSLSPSTFHTQFSSYLDTHRRDDIRKRKHLHDDTPVRHQWNLSSTFISHILTHLIERISKGDDMWESLELLIRTNLISGRTIPELIQILIEQKKWSLIEQSLLHIHDLPEISLVTLLMATLSAMGEKQIPAITDGKKEKKSKKKRE